MSRVILLTTILLGGSLPAAAQTTDAGYWDALTPSMASIAKTMHASIRRNLAEAAEKMPAESFAFKPTPEVRSFGELIGHLANEHYLLCSPLKGEANPMAKVDFEKTTGKTELVKAINDSNAYCDAAYASMKDEAKTIASFSETRRDTPFRVMLLNVTHDNEHYGNIITYLRMKGIVPPSSTPTR